MDVLSIIRGPTSHSAPRSAFERLVWAGLVQLLVVIFGTGGYYLLTDEEFSVLDCLYMTIVTVTTVGYDEFIPVKHDPVLQIFTIVLIIVGMAAVLYFVTVLAVFIVEGELREIFRRKRMAKTIDRLDDHFVIAGLGRTGRNIATDVVSAGKACVLVDTDKEALEEFIDTLDEPVPFVVGDATDDDILEEAGICTARGVAFCLGTDKENLFATISAHRLNPEARIITRGDDPRSREKFLMAGATEVIYINNLGGRYMATELVRPQVSNFLALLFEHPDRDHDIDKIRISDQSPLLGKSLAEIALRDYTDALVIALVDEDGESHFSPGPSTTVEAGYELVVLARNEEFAKIEEFLERGRWPG